MIENQRMNTFGSNESQEGLESSPMRGENKLTKDQWLICISEKIKSDAVNLIRFCFCLSLGLVLASNISAKQYKQLSNGIMVSNEIVLGKGLRGVFPPLQGTRQQLIGKWKLAIITQTQNISDRFNKYSLTFKTNGQVQITNSKCNGDIKMKWYTFYYNIAIKQKLLAQGTENSEMEIPNQKEDIECIVNNGEFMKILNNLSIWAVNLNNLYMISEGSGGGQENSKMLIFKKA